MRTVTGWLSSIHDTPNTAAREGRDPRLDVVVGQ